ncbi:MAG: cupin domain-containing protein [Chloroflexi bacterium]|nr:cupin domain-containing protein [Chloroflexota bacterium]
MMSPIEPNVGQRIRTIRERQGLSLRAVAERCGLSINAISLIERGENSPTVSSLHHLATALGVPITSFFEDPQEQTVVFVQPQTRLRSEANGITLESLGLGLRNQQLEPFLLTVAPGANNLDQPISHPGEELVYCLEGEIVYYVGGQDYRLVQGFSLLFQATQAHCFHNDTANVAQLMLVFHASEGSHLARPLHLAATPQTFA